MKNYFDHIKIFFYRFLLLAVLFSISRFLFYLFNINYFDSIKTAELLKIMFFGIRFDLSALYYFNILFILLSLIPGKFKNLRKYQSLLLILFVVINSVLLATNYIDTKFFDFEHKRLTADIFSDEWLGEDFITLLPAFIRDYWYLIIIWFVMCFGLYKFYPRLQSDIQLDNKRSIKNTSYQVAVFILLMGVGLLFGRGGFQLKPLRVIHAAEYTSAKNIPLVLNTPFTIMKSFGTKNIEVKKYFDQDELTSIYSPVKRYSDQNPKDQNIVVIILESFSKEYIGTLNNGSGYTPFLDSLIKESLVFTNAFANGKRSMEAMPSIMAGLPALTDETYITSRYASNQINSIATILNKKGYHSAFFHGGKNGTMGFDKFAEISGFEEYYGMDEYPYQEDYDNNWGIYDEPYLKYFSDKLSEFDKPFFTSIFTLTSHHPYEVPKKYKGKFPKGTLNIHESIGYSDFALKQFFRKVRKAPWFSNTLFIITADHTAQAEKAYYKNRLGNYAIPIIFYHPTDSLFKGMSEIIAQQTDIFPTIIDYLGINDSFICFGNSLLSNLNDRFTVNYINGIYQLYKDDYLLQFDEDKSIGLYNIKKDSLLQNNLVDHMNEKIYLENYLKAVIQTYQQRVVSNNLTIN